MSRRLPKLVPLEVKEEKKPDTKDWRRRNAPPPDPEMRFSDETIAAANARARVKAILEDPNKAIEVIERANNAGRVISPSGNRFSEDDSHPLFEDGMTYLRRYFIAMPNNGTSMAGATVCRGCGEVCINTPARGRHKDCQTTVSEVLYRLQNKGNCVGCGKEADDHRSSMYWHRVPLCSQQCLMRWDRCNPDPFRAELRVYTEEKGNEGLEH